MSCQYLEQCARNVVFSNSVQNICRSFLFLIIILYNATGREWDNYGCAQFMMCKYFYNLPDVANSAGGFIHTCEIETDRVQKMR
jgi:hypothetical protein